MKKIAYILVLNLLVSISAFASNEEKLNKEAPLNIYPNPVKSGQEINLEMKLDEHKLVHIYIYDFAGKLMMESKNLRSNFGGNHIQEKIIIAKKGLYLIKIVTEDEETLNKQSKVKKLYVI